MYPLLLIPPIKDYLWGGTKLKTEFGLQTDLQTAAEAWVLSCHKDGSSVVANGELAGKTLPQALEIFGQDALGERAKSFSYFPILIKLIDAKQRLSVQVHPNDEYALKNEGEYGKTEMWYVVNCDEGAELIYGFKEDISKEEFETRIKNNTLTDVCNFVPVHKGDVFFIAAGTLHSIGEGILIAEVQQNSNTTYRASDYGRLGADGKPRELHIEKAVAVTETTIPKIPYGKVDKVQVEDTYSIKKLAKCHLFTVELLEMTKDFSIKNDESFVSIVVLDGRGALYYDGGCFEFKKGDSVFIPAKVQVELSGKAEILISSI